jgi:hypothetical protein
VIPICSCERPVTATDEVAFDREAELGESLAASGVRPSWAASRGRSPAAAVIAGAKRTPAFVDSLTGSEQAPHDVGLSAAGEGECLALTCAVTPAARLYEGGLVSNGRARGRGNAVTGS